MMHHYHQALDSLIDTSNQRGFKSLHARVDKFSGQRGDDYFEVWVEDFMEATTDCGWNDDD